MMPGKLNIVSTPIGNFADITFRALRILNESEYIVCEEFKEANKFLKFFDITKKLVSLNEHNESESSEEIFYDIASGKNISLISDCGTPLFSDPGYLLLRKCIDANLKVDFIPGVNSVLAALAICGFDISRFFFYGFLSPKAEIRKSELKKISGLSKVIILMDAPYRLKAVLSDIRDNFEQRNIFVGFNITMKTEKQFRGTAAEILSDFGEEKIKGEFIIIINKK